MKLSRNSWHYRLYRLAYGHYVSIPGNLCSLFWANVFALVMFIPFGILSFPYMLFVKSSRDEGYISDNFFRGMGWAFVTYGIITLAVFPFIPGWQRQSAGMLWAAVVNIHRNHSADCRLGKANGCRQVEYCV